MSELVDAHCHINFFKNAGEVALNCEKNNTHTIYVTTLPSQFDATYNYVKNLQYVYPSLGFHCLETECDIEKEKELFLKNINISKFIGEVGLDFSKKSQYSKEKQIDIFEFILKNIQHKNKILSVHSLNAEDSVLELLLRYKLKKVIFHWYTGKISTLNKIIDSNYYFSINLSMCRSKKGKNIISKIPKDKILIETDSPFIKDIFPYSNEEVYVYLSNIWNMKIDAVKKQILKNFIRLIDG
jgi:TatD DNase family protein